MFERRVSHSVSSCVQGVCKELYLPNPSILTTLSFEEEDLVFLEESLVFLVAKPVTIFHRQCVNVNAVCDNVLIDVKRANSEAVIFVVFSQEPNF